MEKIYNPHNIEQLIYQHWEQKDYFKPSNNEDKENFCIMIPPPNITGNLHIGHAFQQTIIDTLIRYQRMLGKNVLYQVGTDHAGIATQMIIEHKIAIEEGKSRLDYTRDEFIKKIWKWQVKSNETITKQMRRLGNSIDWKRQCFTMDTGFSRAVKEVFIKLYKENLIYRGKRLVNWDLKLGTAISDIEIENRESKGYIWYIRYPLENGVKTFNNKNYLVVATTRPETILGDTGIAVNPEDYRYKNLIGKLAIVPLLNRYIPIIGDKYININKGTGCVKITPAHDFHDYEIGQRHKLPMINIFTFSGNILKKAQIFDFRGNKSNIYSDNIPVQFHELDRFNARILMINIINEIGLLEATKPHNLSLPYGDRSGFIIEPMLTNQWFVRTSKLAKPAIEAVLNQDIKFIPQQYKNMYFSWMHNIKDWCISRQLWWGHRIPAWYDEYGNVYVGNNKEEIYKTYDISRNLILNQDEDVLDTWFSSALWTFSSLGWPNKTNDMHKFHPANVIVSGFDIIFFWIARMIMMTMHFIKNKDFTPQIPFKIVYITGLIRDDKGEKMSKSKGNVIDPIDMIDGISLPELITKRTSNMMKPHLAKNIRQRTKKQFPNGIPSYGTDALRFTLITLSSSTGRYINWDMKKLESYRNFCNKLWNASRFVILNTKDHNFTLDNKIKSLSLINRYILTEFHQVIKTCREALDSFHFNIVANNIYEFTWNHFCDWYLEFTKSVINTGNEIERHSTRNTLIIILEALLRLAHPIIPFITEKIWLRVKNIMGIQSDTIMLQPFPESKDFQADKSALSDIKWLKQLIIAIRNIRAEIKIRPNKLLELIICDCINDKIINLINKHNDLLKTLARLKNINILPINYKKSGFITKIIDGCTLVVPIDDFINKNDEISQLDIKIQKIQKEINYIQKKLTNKNFLIKAPKNIVAKEQNKLSKYIEIRMKLIKEQSMINKS